MGVLVSDCPRCRSKNMTFDLQAAVQIGMQDDWQRWYEAFCICRHCQRPTIFVLKQKDSDSGKLLANYSIAQLDPVSNHLEVDGFINIKDMGTTAPPEHVPEAVANAFREGASSLAIRNWNAAGAMFSLAIDLTTRPMLPKDDVDGLNSKTRRDLGLRLPWLFGKGLLPNDLRDLSSCVREDGNDGAHAGTLTKEDALDLLDFTTGLLERIFTEPTRLKLAKERRDKRRGAEA